VVVVIDPWAVLWPGFWLSFGAVAIILYATIGRTAPRPQRADTQAGVAAAPRPRRWRHRAGSAWRIRCVSARIRSTW
jgi:competence protein ComEC